MVQLSGILKRIAVKLSKACNDLRLLSSGSSPRPSTHLGDGTIHVVDLDRLAVVATIPDVSSVHGIAAAGYRHSQADLRHQR
ncbi:hypothetical protein [Pseudarthrobacter sp. N5]|uniref:hypothetical protein n=1 Tax=Pseudarthrobacter sp. N5 TaxID=3418416 RepID=UPI003CF5BCB4